MCYHAVAVPSWAPRPLEKLVIAHMRNCINEPTARHRERYREARRRIQSDALSEMTKRSQTSRRIAALCRATWCSPTGGEAPLTSDNRKNKVTVCMAEPSLLRRRAKDLETRVPRAKSQKQTHRGHRHVVVFTKRSQIIEENRGSFLKRAPLYWISPGCDTTDMMSIIGPARP